jgi:NADP-dependent 3-hydroxy acid dehydrogenase YdfG
MKDFKDKVAVITGAASGIGLALAEHISLNGMDFSEAHAELFG